MLSDEYKSLAEQAGAGAAFSANILLWAQTGYFDARASLKPLLHLWSLGVEEQFYIVWPMILILAHRFRLNTLSVTAFLALASFASNIQLVHEYPAATFFLPHSRIWELLAGCMLAYGDRYHRESVDAFFCRVVFVRVSLADKHDALANVKAIIGATMIAYSVAQISNAELYPGWHALLPVIGAVFIISAGPGASINRIALGNRAMMWIGLISYPLYLWHWPLLSFARVAAQHEPSWRVRLTLIAVSFVLAALTYWLVERRVRHRKHVLVPSALALAMVLVAGQSYATYRTGGFPSRTARFENVEKAVGDWAYPTEDMHEAAFQGIKIRYRNAANPKTTLFVGDSNIEQYWSRVDEMMTTEPRRVKSVVFATQGGCAPIPGVTEPKHPACDGWIEKVARYATTNSNIDTVYISAYWIAYLDIFKTYTIQQNGRQYSTASEPGQSYAIAALKQMMQEYRASGKRVVLILNIPDGDEFDPRTLVSRSLSGFHIKSGGSPRSDLLFEKLGLRTALVSAARDAGAQIIDPADFLCRNGFCAAWIGDEPIYKDEAHLRASYVRRHVTFLDSGITAQ